jgi:tRNA uridine 5-carboxymethylaminomethyl modification enzyme
MPGCESAEILQYGYAVEYDMVPPHQIDATAMTKSIRGLFLAGQINGTSGYEEAAGQGLVAGVNASRFAAGEPPVTLGREQAYIGVMMDDLVTRTPREPYRMFTSRAEHRLLLRSDNAADRLTPLGRQWGTVCAERWQRYQSRAAGITQLNAVIDSARVGARPMREWIKAPDVDAEDLREVLSSSVGEREPFAIEAGVLETVLAERQYEGYIRRHQAEARRQADMERRRIPPTLDCSLIHGLRAEAREAMARFKPMTVGQAGRLEGVTPADLTLVLVAMARHRDGAAPSIA